MDRTRTTLHFINVGHLLDHLFMLVFPTAVLGMTGEFAMSYAEMIGLSLGGFIAFGAGSVPAGWLADRWSRRNMMALFFIGTGVASIVTATARSAWELALALTVVGLFASIYHPVGTAIVVALGEKVGKALSANFLFGNLGVAFAALLTGAITQWLGWRAAFVIPGAISVAVGVAFLLAVPKQLSAAARGGGAPRIPRAVMVRAFVVLTAVTIAGGVIFSAITVSLPKVIDEQVSALAGSPLGVGMLATAVYLVGAVSQIIVGRLIDRRGLREVFVPLALIQVVSLIAAVWAGEWVAVIAAAAVMFGVFGQVIINDAMVARYTADAWRARAYSVRYLVSFASSALAVPLIAVTRSSGEGFGLLFAVLTALSVVVLVGALMFPPGDPERQTDAAPA